MGNFHAKHLLANRVIPRQPFRFDSAALFYIRKATVNRLEEMFWGERWDLKTKDKS